MTDDIYFGEEDAKYVKTKPKKKVKKSKHKHTYDAYCVAINPDRKTFNKSLVKYCSKCGKIYNISFFPNEETIDRLIKQKRFFNVENSNELFSTLKYVPIELKDKNDN